MNPNLPKILIKMSKICIYGIVLQLSVFTFAIALNSDAQSKSINEINVIVDLKGPVTLEDLIELLENSTGFSFSHIKQELNTSSYTVTLDSREYTLGELLRNVASQTDLSFHRVNEYIQIRQRASNVDPVIEEIISNKTVSGTIVDENDDPMPGASILEKGTTNGTISDAEGKFSLNVREGATLIISFVGYKRQEIMVNSQSVIQVSLQPDFQSLVEVVVIGYGTKKRDDVITSISSIKTDEILKVPSSDIGEMLRGRAAGVFVTVGDAGPGSSSNILIRGRRSLAGGNAPLVIADGVPVGSINDINPNDIETMDILKDATAQAIYGARAANGVILITTKRGEEGKTSIDYNGYYGMQTVRRNFDVYSPEEFIQLKREAFRTENNGIYRSDREIFTPTELEVMESGEYIDWEEELLEIAPITQHNLSVSSANEKTSVYASLNYLAQDGVVPGTDFQRGTIRLNADQKLTEWLKVGVNTSWQLSQNNTPGTENTLLRSITSSPLGKIYNEDGSLRLNPSGVQESFNPLLDIETTSTLQDDRNDIMNLFLEVTPFERFKYKFNGSRRSWNRKTTSYSTAESLVGIQRGGQGYGFIVFEDNVEWQLENILSYNFDVAENHSFNITGVQSIIHSEYNLFRNEASNFPNDILGVYGLATADINTPSVAGNSRSLVSFAGRIEYDHDNRYFATASIRTDGSTVFGANNKWASFPALAAGWNVSNESFFPTSPVNLLKIRASYGSVGEQGIPPYGSQSLAVQSNYIFDGTKVTGYVPGTTLPNPDLKWETSTTLNIGVDFGIWTSRLTGTIEVYDTRTTDLLVNQTLNAASGYTNMLTNLGEVQNKGLELSLNGILVEEDGLLVSLGFNASRNINKIISLYGEDEDGDGEEDDDIGNRWFIGHPIDVLHRFEVVGIFQEGENIVDNTHQPDAKPGDLKLYDRDPEDGQLNATDRVVTSLDPEWYGSFNLNVEYKGFDFTATVYTVQGIVKDNPYLYQYSRGGSLRAVFSGIRQNYWTPENPTGNWPRPNAGIDPENMFALGTQDASYIRLQNVTVGYSLPNRLIPGLGINRLRLYATGQNLFTWTDYQSYSPEKTPDQYPEAIMITGGIQLGF